MKKIVLFAFNGESMCFVHVLLNALDMHGRGYDVKLVIEGSATKLVKELDSPDATFGNVYREVKEKNLVDCVCKACSQKMGSLTAAQEQGLRLCDELKGHPSIARYIEQGYEVLTF